MKGVQLWWDLKKFRIDPEQYKVFLEEEGFAHENIRYLMAAGMDLEGIKATAREVRRSTSSPRAKCGRDASAVENELHDVRRALEILKRSQIRRKSTNV